MKQYEEIILSIQDHWITLLRPAVFLFLGGTMFFFVHHAGQYIHNFAQPIQLLVYLFSYITLLISIHFFFMLILQWLISSIVITNKRIIEMKYLPFMIDDINHIQIDKINEVKKIKHGLFKNILNYGEVEMSISETQEVVTLSYIRKPNKFVNLIEAVKFNTPLEKLDLKGIGASLSEKYAYLKKSL